MDIGAGRGGGGDPVMPRPVGTPLHLRHPCCYWAIWGHRCLNISLIQSERTGHTSSTYLMALHVLNMWRFCRRTSYGREKVVGGLKSKKTEKGRQRQKKANPSCRTLSPIAQKWTTCRKQCDCEHTRDL